MLAGYVAATDLPEWEKLFGRRAEFPADPVVRSLANPGAAPKVWTFVQINASDPFNISLPDPRLTPGAQFVVTLIDGEEPVTWIAFPGTLINGAASWEAHAGPHGGYTFTSLGTQWRVTGLFNGV